MITDLLGAAGHQHQGLQLSDQLPVQPLLSGREDGGHGETTVLLC